MFVQFVCLPLIHFLLDWLSKFVSRHHIMNLQSTHHHSLINSIPEIHHQPNLNAPIKSPSNDENEVVFLCSVPKVIHTPEEYDPKCKCSTCKLVKKLLAECTCAECRGQQQTNQVNQTEGQVVQSSENAPIHNQVSVPNGQPSESSIRNNDETSTSEHMNANGPDDDRESRSSTPDYLPRFFGDESAVSESESESSVDDNSSDPDYVVDENDDDDDPDYDFSKPSSSKFSKEYHAKSSSKGFTKPYKSLNKRIKCPNCNLSFATNENLSRHDRVIHQQLKSFYCKFPKCDFGAGRRDTLNHHITVKHFNHRKDTNKAQLYIGKCESSAKENVGNREESPSRDPPVLDQFVGMKLTKKRSESACPRCERIIPSCFIEVHLRIHKKSGYRCTWSGCGFFFSRLTYAKKHVCADHLQVEMANSQQTNQYLVKVNPTTGQTSKVAVRHH